MSKLFGVETSFTNNRKTAKPGYISNTQYGIVTGTHAVFKKPGEDVDLYRPGRAVYLHDFSVDDGCGEVSLLNNPSEVPFGVLAMSHAYCPSGLFKSGDVANIITFGCVYMICSSNMEFEKIHFGKQVSIVRNWGSVINSDNLLVPPAGLIKTRWYFTGAIEKGVYDKRFGKVNVAEVMVVPGGVVDQGNPGGVTPSLAGHRKTGDTDWYSYGATYLLPNKSVANGEKVEFEFFANAAEIIKQYYSDDQEKIDNVADIKRTAFTYVPDYDRNTDALVNFVETVPAINQPVDLSDGVGKVTGKFLVSRRKYEEKVPTWCAAVFVYTMSFKDGTPPQSVNMQFMVRFEV